MLTFALTCADDLLRLHDGDLDELSSGMFGFMTHTTFTAAAIACCRKICSAQHVPSWQAGPTLVEVKGLQPSGLGTLMVCIHRQPCSHYTCCHAKLELFLCDLTSLHVCITPVCSWAWEPCSVTSLPSMFALHLPGCGLERFTM